MEMNPVGQWLRIDAYDRSTGGFDDTNPGISLTSSHRGKESKFSTLGLAQTAKSTKLYLSSKLDWCKAVPWEGSCLDDLWNSS